MENKNIIFLWEISYFISQERIDIDEFRRLDRGTDTGFYRLISKQLSVRQKDVVFSFMSMSVFL
jgi:hypothetical protein